MNLTGKQLVANEIITGLLDENGNLKQEYTDNVQQHGVDLNLIAVSLIDGTNQNGVVPYKGKTVLAQRIPMLLTEGKEGDPSGWYLMPGAYDITFAQGCKVPSDKMLLIRQRSSLLRNGTILHSSVFDAGFQTQNIGTVMIVMTPIFIHHNARVAQIYAHNSNEVENLYDGQWQGDKQRG